MFEYSKEENQRLALDGKSVRFYFWDNEKSLIIGKKFLDSDKVKISKYHTDGFFESFFISETTDTSDWKPMNVRRIRAYGWYYNEEESRWEYRRKK